MRGKEYRSAVRSRELIHQAMLDLICEKNLNDITIKEVVDRAKINRSTFYANYIDIFDLADRTRETLEQDFSNLFADYDYFNERSGALKMFYHIKENQIFYKTYFKLCYDDKHLISTCDPKRAEMEQVSENLRYHIEFFRNGLNAIIKLWLAGGCQESPEEMTEVLKQEYRGR